MMNACGKKGMTQRVAMRILCVISLLFFLISLGLLISTVRLLGDDLWYYTFLRHDVRYLVDQMATQYLYGSGRLLVHVVLAFFLSFDSMVPVQIANAALLILTMVLVVRLAEPEAGRRLPLFVCGGAFFLLMGNYVIADAYLWLSGSFNYLLPICLLLGYLYAWQHADASGGYRVFSLVCCVLSALTTELNSVLTLVAATVSLILVIRAGKPRMLAILHMAASLCGALFLFLSPGMLLRFTGHGEGDGLIRRCLISATTFSQMIWERDGMAVMLAISALLAFLCAAWVLHTGVLAAVEAAVCGVSVLCVCGVSLPAYLAMALSALYMLALVIQSILLYRRNREWLIPACTVAIFLSAGVICASAEATYRMLFVPAFCLLVISIRSLSLLRLSDVAMVGILAAACVLALCNVTSLYGVERENARVWDADHEAILSYSGDGAILLENVPDERYYQSAYQAYFLGWYLSENGMDGNVSVERREATYYTLTDEAGNVLSDRIVRRDGVDYVYCRTLAEYIGADVSWNYGTANLSLNGVTYRLKSGLHTVITGYIGGRSIPLQAPIRSINDQIYISVADACAIFDLTLDVR